MEKICKCGSVVTGKHHLCNQCRKVHDKRYRDSKRNDPAYIQRNRKKAARYYAEHKSEERYKEVKRRAGRKYYQSHRELVSARNSENRKSKVKNIVVKPKRIIKEPMKTKPGKLIGNTSREDKFVRPIVRTLSVETLNHKTIPYRKTGLGASSFNK